MKKIKKTINQLDIPSAIFGSIIGSIVAFVSFMIGRLGLLWFLVLTTTLTVIPFSPSW